MVTNTIMADASTEAQAGNKQRSNPVWHITDCPDLTIACKGSYTLAHRKMFRPSTMWFDHNMDYEGSVSLESEKVWAIELLINYVYTGEYDWHAANYDRIGTGDVSCLDAHAHVYALAGKLEMRELQTIARRAFREDSQECCTSGETMHNAAITINTEIELLSTDKKLQKHLIDAWVMGGRDLARWVEGSNFKHLMVVAPDFVADLHTRMLCGFSSMDYEREFQFTCKDCGDTSTIGSDYEPRQAYMYCAKCGCDYECCELVGKVRLSDLPTAAMFKP